MRCRICEGKLRIQRNSIFCPGCCVRIKKEKKHRLILVILYINLACAVFHIGNLFYNFNSVHLVDGGTFFLLAFLTWKYYEAYINFLLSSKWYSKEMDKVMEELKAESEKEINRMRHLLKEN